MISAAGIDVAPRCQAGVPPRHVVDGQLPATDRGRPALVAGWAGGSCHGRGRRPAGGTIAGAIERDRVRRPWRAAGCGEEGSSLPSPYLLASPGIGTSVLSVEDGGVARVGGTALGGGTVLGLGKLLLGVESFAELTALAERGDRRTVDLMVGDVYRSADAPLLRDLTAASFAARRRNRSLAHALMGLVGENVALLCGGFARGSSVEGVVYCGSTLSENPALRRIVAEITTLFGHRPCFLAGGAFCGAVGAAAT